MFTVTPEEFIEASRYFALYPDRHFKKRKDPDSPHSFIKLKMDDPSIPSIFAISNKHEGTPLLGIGGNAKVKRVKNEHGEEFALKIEGGKNLINRTSSDPCLILMRQMGIFKGQTTRIYDQNKSFLTSKKEINSKRYTLMELIEGENLVSILVNSQRLLSSLQKRLLALSLSLNLYPLHCLNFAHSDVSASNFVVIRIINHDIVTRIIDFDFALNLSPSGYATWNSARGTRTYMAPEVLKFKRYSKCSDIYALGCIFEILGLYSFSGRMRSYVPNKRPVLEQIILWLVHDIQCSFGQLDNETTRTLERALNTLRPYALNKFKQTLPLSTIFNLKIFQCLSESEKAMLALRCCQAVLAFSLHGKHFHLLADKLTVYLDEQSIDVSHHFELLPEEIDEFSLVYDLGKIVEALGLNPGNMKAEDRLDRFTLAQTIPFLIQQIPESPQEPFMMRILDDIRKSTQDCTTGLLLTFSTLSLTSSGGSSSFSLNLKEALKDLIQNDDTLEQKPSTQTLTSLPSTTSPHSATSELPDFERLELTPSPSFTVGVSAAAAAATIDSTLDRAPSLTPHTKRFGTLRKILHLDTASSFVPKKTNLSKR